MSIVSAFLFLTLGLVILVIASDWLVQGAVKLSFLSRLSPLFIAMVLVAFGTSAPEAGVGIIAALKNQKSIALGNIIGSNIANIGLILGICALTRPLRINKQVFKREVPIMLVSAFLFYALSIDLLISRVDGLILIICFVGFCFISYRGAKDSFDVREIEGFKLKKIVDKTNSRIKVAIIMLFSLSGLVFGADLMVKGGVALANIFKISPWIIGITVFAVGTSLPELAASLSATLRKVPSISAGNIIGSNIFNVLFVLGVVALIRPINVKPDVLTFALPVMVLFSIFLFIIGRTKYQVTRREGLAMLLGYVLFIVLILKGGV